MDDGYGPDANGVVKSRVIFSGLPPDISIEDGFAGVMRIICVPVIILILVPIFFCARQLVSPPPSNHLHFYSSTSTFILAPRHEYGTQPHSAVRTGAVPRSCSCR